VLLQLAGEFNHDLLTADRVAKLLDDLLDLVVELRLRADRIKALDEFAHDFLRVVSILFRHHADQEHNALDESAVVKVEVCDQVLEDLLVCINQIVERFKEFDVPLDDRLLLLSTALLLVLVVLFHQALKNEFKFFCLDQNLNDGSEEAPIHVFDELFASRVNPL
jgi:hypothetical protein